MVYRNIDITAVGAFDPANPENACLLSRGIRLIRSVGEFEILQYKADPGSINRGHFSFRKPLKFRLNRHWGGQNSRHHRKEPRENRKLTETQPFHTKLLRTDLR